MSNTDTLYDKDGIPIQIGDIVASRQRGGKHFGKVIDIVTTEQAAEERGVKHPPKVLFYTQKGEYINPPVWVLCYGNVLCDPGKLVQHNPQVLVHGEDPREVQLGEEQPQK